MPNIEQEQEQAKIMRRKPVIGLFGTCGGSKWRDAFMQSYDQKGIYYFNPDKGDNWHPEDAVNEAEHLKHDDIILFPVTGETYGTGSSSEVGFSIQQAIQQNRDARIVVMIEDQLSDGLTDPVARKESERSRRLVKAHLAKVESSKVFVVDDLEQMLEISEDLYKVAEAEKIIGLKLEKMKEAKREKAEQAKSEKSEKPAGPTTGTPPANGGRTNDDGDGRED